jgi:hypothetical protein
MRRAEGAPRHQRLPGREQADDAVNLGGFERLVQGQRWQNRGEPFGEHGFSGAGRADQQRVVSARRRDFERAFDVLLAFDFGEVNVFIVVLVEKFYEVNLRRRDFNFAFEKGGGFAQILNRNDLQAGNDRCLSRVFRRHEHAGVAVGPGSQRNREHSFASAHRAGEGEFTDDHKVVELVGFDLFAGSQHADGDGQIKARPFLFHVGRREVDGGAAHREFETGIDERGRDAVARFLHGGVRQADDDDERVTPAGVDLHFDGVSLNAVDGG